jgi:predicted small metal-binding protein
MRDRPAGTLSSTTRRSGMKEFRCGTLVPGCEAAFHGESEDEILQHIAAHARDEHGMAEVPPEVVDRILASISERPATA